MTSISSSNARAVAARPSPLPPAAAYLIGHRHDCGSYRGTHLLSRATAAAIARKSGEKGLARSALALRVWPNRSCVPRGQGGRQALSAGRNRGQAFCQCPRHRRAMARGRQGAARLRREKRARYRLCGGLVRPPCRSRSQPVRHRHRGDRRRHCRRACPTPRPRAARSGSQGLRDAGGDPRPAAVRRCALPVGGCIT